MERATGAAGVAGAAEAEAAGERATRAYAEHRELLFSLVYNLLGSVADTEDVLQDTWLAWTARATDPAAPGIEHPKAYLVRIAVNRALAQQAAAVRRRETYVGPWLPEPLVGPLLGADGGTDGGTGDVALAAERAESVSLALLVVLETLSPLERTAFVLHEVFGYSGAEVAAVLGRSPAAVRQLVKRARAHVQERRPRYEAEPAVRRQVTERFLAAALGGDLKALLELLAPDVTLIGDGGGKAPGGRRPLTGRTKVARLLAALAGKSGDRGLEVTWRSVNGAPAAAFSAFGRPFAVLVLDLAPEGDLVRGIHAVSNPDKLRGVA
ncbi:RNA polymerase sigma factor SigJ [Kitasatospora phosalacinea]|uniref:RNA polymerase sigma24 factor n=1 Tax=Kitasatospora phosalacinea TaxID=2065 RepID=A0A9W6PLQ2_9ACTN|nr:RNA polymerase sigma factor SigJ [Kitasatospora phosalacinea]GLW58595.1 RNA polymerase sigma24 factor [Kitasatospora phosalacinea]